MCGFANGYAEYSFKTGTLKYISKHQGNIPSEKNVFERPKHTSKSHPIVKT